MTRQDKQVLVVLAMVAAIFVISPLPGRWFDAGTRNWPLFMGFVKFAMLATFGEALALRLTAGVYNRPGFGLAPKAVVWGLIGMVITIMFMVFGAGIPAALAQLGLIADARVLAGPFSGQKLLAAFSVSVIMNLTFAPLFMVAHKMTDLHIADCGGQMAALWTRPDAADLLARVNWPVMWGFVFVKTLPLFWIPMHTITFLLPPGLRVLFAAALGIALGVILAFASLQKKQ